MSLYTHAGSTEREIRDRFKKLALKWHPDKNLHDPDEAQKVSAVSDQTALARMKPEHSPLTCFGYSVETPPPYAVQMATWRLCLPVYWQCFRKIH